MTEKKVASGNATPGAPVADTPGSDVSIMDACIAHAKEVKATQLELIKSKGYDFAPEFKDMTIQLYLLGVMWRFAENMGGADDARELAFAALGNYSCKSACPNRKWSSVLSF